MSDAAYTMFPTDAPTDTPATSARLISGGAIAPNMRLDAPAKDQQPFGQQLDASKLFPSEDLPDPARSVGETMETFALSAWRDGDKARAEDLRAASGSLAEDFRQSGMDADQVKEIMDLTREHQANLLAGPLPAEMIRQQTERGYEALTEAGVTDADLILARRLVDDMERKTPGLKAYLDQTGMGSDPRTVQAAIKEARRRYGR